MLNSDADIEQHRIKNEILNNAQETLINQGAKMKQKNEELFDSIHELQA